jgi:hypothetical protein
LTVQTNADELILQLTGTVPDVSYLVMVRSNKPYSQWLPFTYVIGVTNREPVTLHFSLKSGEADGVMQQTALHHIPARALCQMQFTAGSSEFRWPTGYGFTGGWTALTDPRNYDNSEYQANRGVKLEFLHMLGSVGGFVYAEQAENRVSWGHLPCDEPGQWQGPPAWGARNTARRRGRAGGV